MCRRHGLYLPEPMADRLELTGSTRHVSKSQILDKSLEFYLNPVTERVATDGLAIEVESAKKALGRPEWDVAAMAYLTALLSRYLLSMTPPLPLRLS